MSTAALTNLWNYIQSLDLSYRNRKWLADRLIEPEANQERMKQETYLRDSLTRAFNEIDEAKKTGKKLQTAEELLEEMKQW